MEILIVDDEPEILKMLTRHLELENFKVTTTASPFQALEIMQDQLINMVLSDIRMPGMSGIELLEKLRKVNPLVNVFMMTGYSNMGYVVDCLAHGAYDYFTKPFTDLDEMIDVLKQGKQRLARWETAMHIQSEENYASLGS